MRMTKNGTLIECKMRIRGFFTLKTFFFTEDLCKIFSGTLPITFLSFNEKNENQEKKILR